MYLRSPRWGYRSRNAVPVYRPPRLRAGRRMMLPRNGAHVGRTAVNSFFFVYTIALILVATIAGVFCLATFVVSRRRIRLVEAAFFASYAYELIGIFRLEWLWQNLPVDAIDYYGVENPVARTLVSAFILLCLWLMLLHYLDESRALVRFAPVVVYVAACLAVVLLMPHGALRQWLFFTLRQIFLAFALLYALWVYHRSNDATFRQRLARRIKNYCIFWAFVIVIAIEDSAVILAMPAPSMSGVLPLYLSTRYFSENFAMVFLALVVAKSCLDELALRFKEPPASGEADVKLGLRAHIDEQLPAFASRHGLSAREREVLALVIEGRDNRNVAGELVLSEGTVKAHVHNNMTKMSTASRAELMQLFWSE